MNAGNARERHLRRKEEGAGLRSATARAAESIRAPPERSSTSAGSVLAYSDPLSVSIMLEDHAFG